MDGFFELKTGKYIINAKSMMWIFCLDLSKPLKLEITDAKESDIERLKKYC